MALTDKQKRFADEYLIDMNATAAYLRAGYNSSEAAARVSASKLLTNPNIVEYIEAKQKRLEKKTEMTQEWVLEKYKELIDNTFTTDPAIAKSALADVAKHLGMFKERIEHSGEMTNKIDFSGLSLQELRQLAKTKPKAN